MKALVTEIISETLKDGERTRIEGKRAPRGAWVRLNAAATNPSPVSEPSQQLHLELGDEYAGTEQDGCKTRAVCSWQVTKINLT